MAARVVEVRDGLRDAIKTAITALANGDTTNVLGRMFVNRDLEQVNSRQVLCFTDGWAQTEAATRAEDVLDYRIRVVVLNRHTGNLSEREKWAEGELGWVDSVIWPLTDARRAFLLDALWCQAAEVVTDYDADWLLEKGVFFHELSTTWREHK